MFKHALVLSTLAAVALAYTPEFNDDGTPKRPTAGFIPKVWPAVIAIALFALLAVHQWSHWFRMGRQRFLLTAPIAHTTMAIGYVLRIVYTQSPYGVGLYSVTTLFVLLSPVAYLAFVYCLLSRLAQSLDSASGEEITKHCLVLPVRLVVKLFVWIDVAVFLLQASGGGMAAIGGSTAKVGDKISIIGLVLQVVSYGVFCIISALFVFRVRQRYPSSYYVSTGHGFSSLSLFKRRPVSDWRVLACVMAASSVGILIRCIFRVAEFAGGYDSYLATTEGYIYLLDALPLWLAMSLYSFLWPARIIAANTPNSKAGMSNVEMGAAIPVRSDDSQDSAYAYGGARKWGR